MANRQCKYIFYLCVKVVVLQINYYYYPLNYYLHVINAYAAHLSTCVGSDRVLAKARTLSINDENKMGAFGAVHTTLNEYFTTDKVSTVRTIRFSDN